jgi:hypothetical protein
MFWSRANARGYLVAISVLAGQVKPSLLGESIQVRPGRGFRLRKRNHRVLDFSSRFGNLV